MKKIKSIKDLKTELQSNDAIINAFKEDPLEALNKYSEPMPDSWVYRSVIISLGASIIFIIIAITWLESNSNGEINESIFILFTAIASGAIGALGGLLSPFSKRSM
ncbi:MAG TPA: hypothetical protein PKC30_14510 [Saprospiraceae bacterium]|nr:hypothetical protein [Saprospiraceae bacterium]